MSGPPTAVQAEPAPPAARFRSLLFTLEAFAYLFWLAFDLIAGPSLAEGSAFEYSSPIAGLLVVAVVLTRYVQPTERIAIIAFGSSAVLSVASSITAVTFSGGRIPALSLAELLALAIITLVIVRQASGLVAVGTAVVSFLVIVGMPVLRFPTDDIDDPTVTALCGLGWASAVALAAVLREIRVRREARLTEARSHERLELARELHDVVAHHVTGIVVAAQAAVTVARTRPEEAGPALESIERAGAEALAGMRRMVGVLRGGEEAGRTVVHGPSDVDELVDRFDPDRTRTTIDRDPDLTDLPPGVGATAYRVVQEALTNVHRHAPDATSVQVGLHRREERLEVMVRNEGGSPERRPSALGRGGFGLAGMAERVGALGGTLQVGPDGPGAWLVQVELPLGGAR